MRRWLTFVVAGGVGCVGEGPDAQVPDVVCEMGEVVLPVQRVRAETYQRIVEDLLGVAVAPISEVDPASDWMDGGEASLPVTPAHVAAWERMVEAAVEAAVAPPTPPVERWRADWSEVEPIGLAPERAGEPSWLLVGSGEHRLEVLAGGVLLLVVEAAQGAPSLEVRFEEALLDVIVAGAQAEHRWEIAGAGTLSLRLQGVGPNAAVVGSDGSLRLEDPEGPAAWVHEARVEEGVANSAPRELLAPCAAEDGPDETCRTEVLTAVARRAWGRSPFEEELAAWASLAELATASGDDTWTGLGLGLRALLLAPETVYRAEAALGLDTRLALIRRLTDLIWQSVPDEALLERFDGAGSPTRAEVEGVVADLLDDPRADALWSLRGPRWLGVDRLDREARDPSLYPDFDQELAASMRAETEAVLAEALSEDLPLADLLVRRRTFVDARLANLYGLAPVGEGFHPVELSEDGRAGLLGHASILTATSTPTRTSASARGGWVRARLLCELDEVHEAVEPLSSLDPAALRAEVEALTAEPACAACHARNDALGHALDGFDAIGAARAGGGGELPDGTVLADAAALGSWVAGRPELLRCTVERWLSDTLGRTLTEEDACLVATLVETTKSRGSLRSVVEAIANSPAVFGPFSEEGP
jgi:hypothetical protein